MKFILALNHSVCEIYYPKALYYQSQFYEVSRLSISDRFFDVFALSIIEIPIVLFSVILAIGFGLFVFSRSSFPPKASFVKEHHYRGFGHPHLPNNTKNDSALAGVPSAHVVLQEQIWKNWECNPLAIITKKLQCFANAQTNKSSVQDVIQQVSEQGFTVAFERGTSKVSIKFTYNIKAEFQPSINVCCSWFANVIDELIGNAIKHNLRRKHLAIEIQLDLQDGYLIFTMTDNGVGISQSVTNKLVHAAGPSSSIIDALYTQLDGPANLLSIQSLLRKMGGSLEVKSAKCFLTKITLNLPLLASSKRSHKACKSEIQKRQQTHSTQCAADECSKQDDKLLAQINIPQQEKASDQLRAGLLNELVAIEENKEGYQATDANTAKIKRLRSQESIEFVSKFKQVLQLHYHDESFKRPFAAKKMLMTEKTLARKLTKYYGCGFVDALKKYRLEKAKAQLFGGDSVTNVALNTGFSSPSYFTRCFKTQYGYAPSVLPTRQEQDQNQNQNQKEQ